MSPSHLVNFRWHAAILGALVLLAAAGNEPIAQPPSYAPIAAMVDAVRADRLKSSVERLVEFKTRNDFSETASTPERGVFGARDWIAARFAAIAATAPGRMSVELDTFLQPKTPRTPRAVTESSVIATLRGSTPGRIYIMSSHYDDCDGHCTDGVGIAPGADDNGSSVAAVLEAARVLAGTRFRGTIVFACFDGEELGLWGSAHYAHGLAARHAPVLAVLNNDIIGNSAGGDGTSEPGVIRVFSESLPAGTDVEPVYVPNFIVRQIFRSDRFLRGGDQQSFQSVGYSAAVRFVEPHENFIHQHQDVRVQDGIQYGDLPQYIDPDYLKRATQANIAALATLALGPAPPGDVRLVTHRLGYDSTLRWKRAADAASYEIVWRSTDAAQWQGARNAGDAVEATVPISKDDYILGVRSVDSNGLRSPAVYPVPVRE
jgi:hypothetical protein